MATAVCRTQPGGTGGDVVAAGAGFRQDRAGKCRPGGHRRGSESLGASQPPGHATGACHDHAANALAPQDKRGNVRQPRHGGNSSANFRPRIGLDQRRRCGNEGGVLKFDATPPPRVAGARAGAGMASGESGTANGTHPGDHATIAARAWRFRQFSASRRRRAGRAGGVRVGARRAACAGAPCGGAPRFAAGAARPRAWRQGPGRDRHFRHL